MIKSYNMVRGEFTLPCCKSTETMGYSHCMAITTRSGGRVYADLTKSTYDLADVAAGEVHMDCKPCEKEIKFQIKDGQVVGRYKRYLPVSIDHLDLTEDELEEKFLEDWNAENDFKEDKEEKSDEDLDDPKPAKASTHK